MTESAGYAETSAHDYQTTRRYAAPDSAASQAPAV